MTQLSLMFLANKEPSAAQPTLLTPIKAPAVVSAPSSTAPSSTAPSSTAPSSTAPSSAASFTTASIAAEVQALAVRVQAGPDVSLDRKGQAQRLTHALATRFGEPIRLVVTDNRRTMISGSRKQGQLAIRLHHMFLDAPGPVLDALHAFLAHRQRGAGQVLDRFIAVKRSDIRHRKRRVRLRTHGKTHALQPMFDEVERLYFANALEGVRITWGRYSTRSQQRSIRLGTYSHGDALVRIHPVLDNHWVPAFYVESVIHHEMLHHVLPPERHGTRTTYHTPLFRRRERAFSRFQEAQHWENTNLSKLLKHASGPG